MAPLIATMNTSSQSTRPSAPSSSLRVPHVFVVPPEEEQHDNPPFCCFDADAQPERGDDFLSHPDIHLLDAPFLSRHSENDVPIPVTRRTSIRQPRPRTLVPKRLERKQRPEAVKIIETKSSRAGQRGAQEDSDVVEVIKVKRTRETTTELENTKAKRSKTLKARANDALRSIKNVGKSHRSPVKDLWASTESMPKGVQERDKSAERPSPSFPKTGSLSRSLSQLFQPMMTSRMESTFTVRVPSPMAPVETHDTLPAASPLSLPHFEYTNTDSSLNEVPSTLTIDNAPTTSIPYRRKGPTTKFSVRELHRLFSFSSLSPDDPSPFHTVTGAPFPSASSGQKPLTPTPTHDLPDVPMEEDIFADAHFVNLDSPDRRLASRYHQGHHPHHKDGASSRRRLSDLSFEMKLDSLHFDALSFNAEDFHVSREGSVPR